MRPLIAGNWKMNGLSASLAEVAELARALETQPANVDVLVCPPFTLLTAAVAAARNRMGIGAQTCHASPSGAHTGDVSAEMIKDAGGVAVIVGHSERRQGYGETDADVAAKVRAAWRAGLHPIICVGETEAEHDAGHTLDVVKTQLGGSLPASAGPMSATVAYEPIWAIGSGRTPSHEEIAGVHHHIRKSLETLVGPAAAGVRILYGGSVKPANAAAILAIRDVDGALVGGASLKAAEFLPIIEARS
jgi:triosephosphate isomerase